MSKQEYVVVEKLQDAGYTAIVKLGEDGLYMKVKRNLENHVSDKTPDTAKQSSAIEPKVFSIAQKFGYAFKEIGAEEYEKGVNSRIVPFVFFIKQYAYEE